jgi:hypothetical protein
MKTYIIYVFQQIILGLSNEEEMDLTSARMEGRRSGYRILVKQSESKISHVALIYEYT